MADEQRFSHITVSSGEEDEVVIHAGAPRGAEAPRAEADEPAEPAARQPQGDPAPAARPARTVADGEAAGAAKAADEGYRETTLADLEEKSPVVQRVVIAAALLLIVCVVVYQVAFA